MKRIASVVASLAFGFATTCIVAGTGPETIVLKGPAGKKEPVTFNHKAHQEKTTCAECHHGKGPDGKQIPYTEGQTIEKCTTCHELGKPSDVMHKNCKDCHKAKGGPTKCTECHKKQ